jgi:hypothetical protein
MSDNQSAAEVPYQLAAAPPSEPGSTAVGSGGGGLLAMIERLRLWADRVRMVRSVVTFMVDRTEAVSKAT